jgi:phosphatidylglycerophosphate synthase
MAGSLIASIALIGCNWSSSWLPLVALGVVLNWFGDSLDGSLARFRKAERPRFGFLVDHTCDLFSQIMIIVAFGLSPFLSLVSALVVLLCYLLFSAYTYIRAAAHHIHQMAYIGVGATEFRILMIVWAMIGTAFNLREPLVDGLSRLDAVILFLAGMAVIGLAFKAISDARLVAFEETKHASSKAINNPILDASENPGAVRS